MSRALALSILLVPAAFAGFGASVAAQSARGLAAEAPPRQQRCMDGFALEPSPNPANADVTRLHDVVVIAPDDIWAVGMYRDLSGQETDQYSLTMHFNGSSWAIVPSPSPPSVTGKLNVELSDVSAVSSNLVYAAGSYLAGSSVSPDTFVVRWDGSTWEHIVSPGQSQFGAQGFLFESVEAIDAGNVWFGGQWSATPARAVMVRFDGSSFSTFLLPLMPNSNGAHRVRSIAALSTDDIWAVGGAGGTASAIGKGYVARWDGVAWQHVPTPNFGFGETFYDVVAFSADEVWVSGTYDEIVNGLPTATPLFLHWNGFEWTRHVSPGFAIDMAASGPNDIFGVSGQRLVHWDGVSWAVVDQIALAQPPRLQGIDVAGLCELVTVGFHSFSTQSSTSLVARYR